MKTITLCIAVTCAIYATTSWAESTDWLEYRGPQQDGHCEAAGIPIQWSESQNVRWKSPIHGKGWSTPVILGNRIWLTTATPDGREMSVMVLDRQTGQVLHDRKLWDVPHPDPLGNDLNSYASPSPVAEPGRVYVHFGSYGTACLDAERFDVLWLRRDLPCNHFRGPASSPILFENLLIFHMDGSDTHYIVALDKRTGQTVWTTHRSADYRDLDETGKPTADGDYRKAYNTPLVIEVNGQPQLVSPSAKAVYGYDPRKGQEIWQVQHDGHSTACRSIFDGQHVLVNTGSGQTELLAIDPSGAGNVTETHVRWRQRKQVPKRSSQVLIEGKLYGVTDQGVAACLRVDTGELIWQQRLGEEYSASLIVAEGRIYAFDQVGHGIVFEPGNEYREIARNTLDDGCMASPIAIGNQLFVRTKTHLYCLEAMGTR